jgi:uncharacterized cupredoxin-like copper-binding protein
VRLTSRRATRAAALLVPLVIVAAGGCAAPAPTPLAPAGAGTDASPRAINVILRDYVFVPGAIGLIPGETVRFNLINGGLAPHEFVLGDAQVQAAWASADAAATPPIIGATAPPATVAAHVGGLRVLLASGESTSVTYRVPPATEAAELQLACQLPGHVSEGMVGTLSIVAAAPASNQP